MTDTPAPITAETWRELAPDYKEKFPEVKDLPGLFKAHESLLHKMGSPNDYLKRPANDATAEQKAAFSTELNKFRGVPEKPEDYAIELKEEYKPYLDEKQLAGFRPVAHQLGLDPAQVAGLAEWQAKQIAEADAANIKMVKEAWGADYDNNLKAVGVFAEKHFSKGFVERYGTDPLVALELLNLRKKLGEGKIELGDKPAGGEGKDDLRKKAIEIQSKPEYAGSEALQKEVKALYERIAGM